MKKIRICAIILVFTLLLSLTAEAYPVQAAKKETKCQKILSMYKNKQYAKVKKCVRNFQKMQMKNA